MSTRKQAASPIVTACPQCGAGLLNAIVRLSLFGVSLEDGLVVDYDGGPQPESEADIIELCAEDNTIIFCEAGHIIGNVSGAQSDPLQSSNELRTGRLTPTAIQTSWEQLLMK